MKKVILFPIICLMANIAATQNLAVQYTVSSTSIKDGKSKTEDTYVLVSDGQRSMFYNPEKWTVDSLMSTPEGKNAVQMQAMAQLAAGKPLKALAKGYYICKNADGTITSYRDEPFIGKVCYTEPLGGIDWQLTGDSTKTVLGYECQPARCDYHGRTWNVLFTTDIPLQEGPWKLCGLPGVILEAEADGGVYSFKATVIGMTNESIPEIVDKDQYDKTERIKFLKEKRDVADHALERMNARFGNVKVTSADGRPITKINASREVIDFIETDY